MTDTWKQEMRREHTVTSEMFSGSIFLCCLFECDERAFFWAGCVKISGTGRPRAVRKRARDLFCSSWVNGFGGAFRRLEGLLVDSDMVSQ